MRILACNDFGPTGFRWLTLKRVAWEDPHGTVRFWEVADRTTRRGSVDGVAIIARVLRAGQEPHIVVISQFRPPLANRCLELPAGLLDGGEDAGKAALRELREETGYTGRLVEVGPICHSDPGMTSANMQIAVLEVDGDAPENRSVKPHLDDGEFISTELVPQAGLLQYLLDVQREKGWEVDARLMALALGLQQGAALAAAAITHSGSSGGAAAAQRDPALSGFGSLLPDDSDLSHAVEAAVAAVAAAHHEAAGANGTKEAAAQVGAPCWQRVNGSAAAQQQSSGWWPVLKHCMCTYQFGAGLATGAALGTVAVVALCSRGR